MDIFEYAMKLELDGKKYYEELMNNTEDIELRNIFKMLAKDEEEHQKVIEDMKAIEEESIRSETLKNSNNIFAKMLNIDKKIHVKASAIKAYEHAIKLEDESMKLYEKHFMQAENEKERSIFRRLAEEEKKHKLILENILMFISEQEKTLIE